MCLLALAFRVREDQPLIVSANRDEYYARPTAPMQWWADAPILAGRDLEAGGTWMGVTRTGRFAALTNLREGPPRPGARSRGALVSGFLAASTRAANWAASARAQADAFAGFNLLLFDGEELVYLSNRRPDVEVLPPGVYALGNAVLGAAWPKIEYAREQLKNAVTAGPVDLDELLALLTARQACAAHLLPDTGVTPEQEALLSAPFIVSELYGTRASTALIATREGHIAVAERRFERGEPIDTRSFRISPEA